MPQLTPADLSRIAEIHVASIDDSIPTMLGLGYARAFFRYLAVSEKEALLVERFPDGRVASACVVSFEPETVYARTMRETFVPLVLYSALAFVRSPRFRRFLVRYVFERSETPHAPEITYIFTDPEARSRGLGAKLVGRVEQFLRERGASVCYVRTVDVASNRALSFYDRQGFERFDTQVEGGRAFVLFRKKL